MANTSLRSTSFCHDISQAVQYSEVLFLHHLKDLHQLLIAHDTPQVSKCPHHELFAPWKAGQAFIEHTLGERQVIPTCLDLKRQKVVPKSRTILSVLAVDGLIKGVANSMYRARSCQAFR